MRLRGSEKPIGLQRSRTCTRRGAVGPSTAARNTVAGRQWTAASRSRRAAKARVHPSLAIDGAVLRRRRFGRSAGVYCTRRARGLVGGFRGDGVPDKADRFSFGPIGAAGDRRHCYGKPTSRHASPHSGLRALAAHRPLPSALNASERCALRPRPVPQLESTMIGGRAALWAELEDGAVIERRSKGGGAPCAVR
eukprot:scaffold21217_cov28-Tisochrysis_lutea.AAC.1